MVTLKGKRLGGKYVTRGVELAVSTTTREGWSSGSLSTYTEVQFRSEDGCTESATSIHHEEGPPARAKVQEALDAEELRTCATCARPHLGSYFTDRWECAVCRSARWERVRAEDEAKRAAEREARRAERKRCWDEFHEVAEMRRLPPLAMLRDVILANNPKRCPKWQYRLAGDLVAEIQPRPTLAEWRQCTPQPAFLGRAFFSPAGFGEDVFEARQADLPRGAILLKFELSLPPEGGAWRFRCDRYVDNTGQRGMEAVLAVRRRLLAEIPAHLTTLCPDVMFSYHCLVCGKALTDPASMARFIGPECWGSASLAVPEADRGLLPHGLWLAWKAGFDLNDSAIRLVAADWLEEQGDADTANWLRQQGAPAPPGVGPRRGSRRPGRAAEVMP
jgi:uncharacterized protein (TIGR02996 family)